MNLCLADELGYRGEIPLCPYCRVQAVLSPDSAIYGRSYGGMVWVCSNHPRCDTYVGAHAKGYSPKGTLADKSTREMRIKAHGAFDSLWRGESACMNRSQAYRLIAERLGLDRLHIGECDKAMCVRVIRAVGECRLSLDSLKGGL